MTVRDREEKQRRTSPRSVWLEDDRGPRDLGRYRDRRVMAYGLSGSRDSDSAADVAPARRTAARLARVLTGEAAAEESPQYRLQVEAAFRHLVWSIKYHFPITTAWPLLVSRGTRALARLA
jgi:hypothetical protein